MKATDRAVELLCLFAAVRPELSTSEVAESLEMAHSSAHELLNGLAKTGLLRKRAPGRFRLGPMINSLAKVLASTDLVLEASRDSVVEMAETYGQTVHIVELMGSRLLSLNGQEGSSQVHVASAIVNGNLPAHPVAPGLLLLSHLPADRLKGTVRELGNVKGPDGKAGPSEQLLAELADIWADNYACEGRSLPSRPRDGRGTDFQPRAHVYCRFALFIPKERYTNEPRAFRNITSEATRKISSRLGWELGKASKGGKSQRPPPPDCIPR